jgi:hypothetical protein
VLPLVATLKADENKGIVETVFHTWLESISPRHPMIKRSRMLKADLPRHGSTTV